MAVTIKDLDDQTKYGFELALKYVELAKQFDKDPADYLKQILKEWKKK